MNVKLKFRRRADAPTTQYYGALRTNVKSPSTEVIECRQAMNKALMGSSSHTPSPAVASVSVSIGSHLP